MSCIKHIWLNFVSLKIQCFIAILTQYLNVEFFDTGNKELLLYKSQTEHCYPFVDISDMIKCFSCNEHKVSGSTAILYDLIHLNIIWDKSIYFYTI